MKILVIALSLLVASCASTSEQTVTNKSQWQGLKYCKMLPVKNHPTSKQIIMVYLNCMPAQNLPKPKPDADAA